MDGSGTTMSVFKRFCASLSKPMIRLIKLEDSEKPKYAPNHPRYIKTGLIAEGLMLRPVTVGQSFYVDYPHTKNHFHTSVVQEILSENTFKTMNSIYKWEKINNNKYI